MMMNESSSSNHAELLLMLLHYYLEVGGATSTRFNSRRLPQAPEKKSISPRCLTVLHLAAGSQQLLQQTAAQMCVCVLRLDVQLENIW